MSTNEQIIEAKFALEKGIIHVDCLPVLFIYIVS